MSMAEDHFTLTKCCAKCKQEKPLTSFTKHGIRKDGLDTRCKTCIAAQKKAWRENNKEKIAAENKAYSQANREKAAARYKSWRKVHGEKEAARNKAWREANLEVSRALQKAWREANPEMRRASDHRRRARKRNAQGTHTAAQIRELLLKQKGKCVYCRKDIRRSYHIDHIIALVIGGSNDIHNIQLLCAHCNCSKSAKDHIIFAQQQGMLL